MLTPPANPSCLLFMQRIRIRNCLVTTQDAWDSMLVLKVALVEMARRAVKRPGQIFLVDVQVGQYNTASGTVAVSYGYRHHNISAAPPTLPTLKGTARVHSLEELFALPVKLAPAWGDPDQTPVSDVACALLPCM